MTEMDLCWAYTGYSCNATITGADDKVDVGWLVETSKKYPFVEWGILIGGEDRFGTPRYPSKEWILEASRVLGRGGVHFATHLCGPFSRGYQEEEEPFQEALMALLFMTIVPQQVRVQINGTRTNKFKSPIPFVEHILVAKDVQQGHLYSYESGTFERSVLFDASGGRGVSVDIGSLVEDFSSTSDMFVQGCKIGLAGGIDASSVQDAIEAVETMSEIIGGSKRWIDMETGARTNNEFDKDKVIAILEAANEVLLP
jgi:phosphoribosylanthranilate isomerase